MPRQGNGAASTCITIDKYEPVPEIAISLKGSAQPIDRSPATPHHARACSICRLGWLISTHVPWEECGACQHPRAAYAPAGSPHSHDHRMLQAQPVLLRHPLELLRMSARTRASHQTSRGCASSRQSHRAGGSPHEHVHHATPGKHKRRAGRLRVCVVHAQTPHRWRSSVASASD